jgi:hypothetical protein
VLISIGFLYNLFTRALQTKFTNAMRKLRRN